MNRAVKSLPDVIGVPLELQEYEGHAFCASHALASLRKYFNPCWVAGNIDDLELFYRAYMFYNRKVLEHHPYMWHRLEADLAAYHERHKLPHFVVNTYYRVLIAAA